MRKTRIKVENKTFRNDDILLDGHSWFKCRFYNCNIIMEFGNFDIVFCEFHDCQLDARNNALAVLKVAKLFFPDRPIP